MKRKSTSAHQIKRTKNAKVDVLDEINGNPTNVIKNTSFVWIGKNMERNTRIQAIIKRLESILPCAIATGNYNDFEQYLMECNDNRNTVLIISNEQGQQNESHIHSLSSIICIYVYGINHENNNEWLKNFPKNRCKMISNINKLVDILTTDLEGFKRNDNIESYCGKQTIAEKKETTKVKHLDPQANAMLKTLMKMVKPAIHIYDDIEINDFNRLSNKSTYFFVSSSMAAKMEEKSKYTQSIFILEEDKSKVNHIERFQNGEDLVFELGDIIYRCYKEEENLYAESGDTLMAEIIRQQANQVHSNLKKAFQSVLHNNDDDHK
ncbi:unnamed protein product [Adineta ricciae]|nr:unnamed protein product [Adineta ricciae]